MASHDLMAVTQQNLHLDLSRYNLSGLISAFFPDQTRGCLDACSCLNGDFFVIIILLTSCVLIALSSLLALRLQTYFKKHILENTLIRLRTYTKRQAILLSRCDHGADIQVQNIECDLQKANFCRRNSISKRHFCYGDTKPTNYFFSKLKVYSNNRILNLLLSNQEPRMHAHLLTITDVQLHLFSVRIGIRAFDFGNGHFISSRTLEVRHWSTHIDTSH